MIESIMHFEKFSKLSKPVFARNSEVNLFCPYFATNICPLFLGEVYVNLKMFEGRYMYRPFLGVHRFLARYLGNTFSNTSC